MADVVVTEAHRRTALEVMGWTEIDRARKWVAAGGDVWRSPNGITSMVDENAIALAVAVAEQRGREAERAAVTTLAKAQANTIRGWRDKAAKKTAKETWFSGELP